MVRARLPKRLAAALIVLVLIVLGFEQYRTWSHRRRIDRIRRIAEAAESGELGDLTPSTLSVSVRANLVRWLLANGRIEEAAKLSEELADDSARAAAGEDILTGRHGTLVLGYVSEVDDSIQPFCVYVPNGYNGTKPYPLIIWLHGRGGFGQFQCFPPQESEDALVLSPDGRGASDYMALGERDLLDALSETRRLFKVDPKRIYVTGHSMGGTGAWSLGVHYPGLFAAIAPSAGNADFAVWEYLWGWTHKWSEPMNSICRFLRERDCAAYYAENLSDTPVLAIHGLMDNVVSPDHTRAAVRRLPAGAPVSFWTFEDKGHGGFSDWTDEQVIGWLLRQELRTPEKFTYRTASLRHGKAYNVEILGRESPLDFSSVSCTRAGGAIRLETKNLSWLRVETLAARSVIIDGKSFAAPRAVMEFEKNGGWRAAGARRGVVKTAGLEGPISDAFLDSFVLVYGTSGEGLMREVAEREARGFAEWWRTRYCVDPRIKADAEVTAAEVERCNLVLFGDSATNSLVKRIAPRLPVRLEGGVARVGDREFQGRGLGIKVCYPNPLNPRKYAVVFAAADWTGMFQITRRFGDWFDWTPFENRDWFDFAVFDERTFGPDSFLCVGWFDKDWRLAERLTFCRAEGSGQKIRRTPSPEMGGRAESGLCLSAVLPVNLSQMKGPVGFDQSALGDSLKIGRRVFERGIGVRAPARVTFDIRGRFSRFSTFVGLDTLDKSLDRGANEVLYVRRLEEKVVFSIYGDGKLIARSKLIGIDEEPCLLTANVRGVKLLELVAEPAGRFVWLYGGATFAEPVVR